MYENEEFLEYVGEEEKEYLPIAKEIDKLRKQRNYEAALCVCNEPRNKISRLINYKQIQVLMDIEHYRDALVICDYFRNIKLRPIQLCRINIFIELDKLRKALKECNKEEYKDDYRFQSRKIKILTLMSRLEFKIADIYEALDICERFSDIPKIQSQKIGILIILRKYDEALEYSNKLDWENNPLIESKRINAMAAKGEYSEAISLCDNSKYSNNPLIISQKIKTLISKHKKTKEMACLYQALEICNEYQNDRGIESQKAIILYYLKRYEEALEICNKYSDSDYAQIQGQKAKMLVALYERDKKYSYLEEALKIYNKNKNNDYLKNSRKRVLYIMDSIKDNNEKNNSTKTNTIKIYLTRVYCNDITREEIEQLNITNWQKDILITALLDKTNKKAGEVYLKHAKLTYLEDKEKLRAINSLLNRLGTKRAFYDITIYGKLLGCAIDSNLAIEKFSAVKNEEIVSEKIVVNNLKKETVIQPKREIQPKSIISVVGSKVEKPVINNEIIPTVIKYTPTKKVLIRDIFPVEIEEVEKYLYIRMTNQDKQKEVVKAWDKFELLVEKESTDKEALNHMVNLLTKLSKDETITININQEKYAKLLTK